MARLPVHLYRLGLGPLFGKRMLLLIHTGRASGRARNVVIEVVAYDAQQHTWTVASGFGPKAQWYRNLRHTPQATIQVGRCFHAVTAHFLSEEEGGRVMAVYAPKHPRAARLLCSYMGFETNGSADSYRAAGGHIPFVRLEESMLAGQGPARDTERAERSDG
ncbi:nitroreductase family deazaflavin-dependent oxidoreductase [Streptomyces sp. SPB162]|uniref:nitroreductase family deazaflavin-dependent oxidoreductase n=1 Tax=Streptomyces sp. SPB162 TaxID=2940560 RepID=UPI00240519A4|nr:nitroreductase family deazaflavin-dependent oxidoreductase [Streptomyces sp. SPB162]MDF9816638.1 deazaflavin-dependent oxidoreductase (nitroreductase family) [Streptomyces sp. SPB162]